MPVGYLLDSGRLAAMGCDLPKGKSYREKICSAATPFPMALGAQKCVVLAAGLVLCVDAPCRVQ